MSLPLYCEFHEAGLIYAAGGYILTGLLYRPDFKHQWKGIKLLSLGAGLTVGLGEVVLCNQSRRAQDLLDRGK